MEEIESAYLQTGTMINGCSQTETTLSNVRIKGIKMWKEPGLLVVLVKGKRTEIPLANIKGMYTVGSHEAPDFSKAIKKAK